ncbi:MULTISPECIES: peptidylprolyl isomerase [Capnocytophaga]|jgi:cyclophilin/fkbp-type peptidyl-prolyl cis-trans isomerase|uniref:peptidylprolyl isomerase n=1 Tax=Capnocytophaga TaxID=1016 RepID=UPI00027C6551|nr:MULTISPECIES: peptidylprolyl isomerase [Capnocytophaga]EJU30986.1 peptidyl-prolyl cis-trans isomerase, cyclophilin-type [Capnocytophaga sp. CM59]
MKKVKLWALLLPLLLVACKSAKYPNLKDGLYADIQTNYGDMLAELYYKATPGTVANFVSLAEGTNTYVADSLKGKRYYDGTKSHRVIKNFMLQAGDRTATGEGDPGYKFADEFVDTLRYTRKGQLGMANSGPATNGSQFFITEVATDWLNFRHTIFGQVIQGEDVISKITSVKTGAQDRPVDPVVIKKVEIIRVGKDAQKWDAPKVFDAFMKEQNAKAQKLESQKEKNLALMAEQEAKAVAQPSGIKILKLKEGNGVKPQIGSDVLVNYAGFLRATGDLFDTNIAEIAKENDAYDAARAADPQYGYIPYAWKYSPEVGLIAGFKEALLSMKVGDRIRVFIPSALAYGKQGFGNGVIPPDADLMFEIEIVDAKVTDVAK